VPDVPYVPLYLAELPEGAEVVKTGGLVVGHKVSSRGSFVFSPVRFPMMRVCTLLVCIEYVDVRCDEVSAVMASFQFRWMNGNGSIRGLYTEPMLLRRDGDIFRFLVPVVSAEQRKAVEANPDQADIIDSLVDTDIALSCGLTATVLTEGAGIIVRSVWLELGD
jgi:hypothetical protein